MRFTVNIMMRNNLQAVADYTRISLELHTQEIGEQPRVLTAARIAQQICYQASQRCILWLM